MQKEKIIKNNTIQNTCNSDYIPILDFINNQRFIIFEKDDRGRNNKNIVYNIRVRIEVEK